MNAMIWKDINRLQFAQVPEPACKPGWVKLRVMAVGVCATEVALIEGRIHVAVPPHILGHEICGDITELGENCDPALLGKRAVVETYVGCGTCEFCRSGRKHLCAAGEIGYPPYNGGDAQYVVVPQGCIRLIPDSISYDEGAIMEAVACPFGALEQTHIQANDTVFIQGAGIAGLSFLQTARAFGAKKVLCTVRNDTKAALVEKFGGYPIDLRCGEVKAQVMKATDGMGADISIDAVGTANTVQTAVACAKSGGKVVLYGLPDAAEKIEFPVMECILRQLQIAGYTGNEKCWDAMISMVAQGKISLRELVSAAFPLSRFEDALALLHSGRPDVIKVVLHPWE